MSTTTMISRKEKYAKKGILTRLGNQLGKLISKIDFGAIAMNIGFTAVILVLFKIVLF